MTTGAPESDPTHISAATAPTTRRGLFAAASIALGGLLGLALAVPGVAYLLDPLNRKRRAGAFEAIATLGELKVGEPKSYAILAERQDAWVKYPREPVGSVWLVRQASKPAVVAFTAECPHLGCAVNLAADGKSFLCPCHTSSFNFDGKALNAIPPRGMDTLEVEGVDAIDPADELAEIRVRFERFRTLAKEKMPLA